MPNLYLTDAFVKSVQCPAGKAQELFWDGPITQSGKVKNNAVGGLGLRVTSRGIKTFVHSYLMYGKRRRVTLGKATAMNVGRARLLVTERELDLANNQDPDAGRTDIRRKQRHSVKEIAELYWEKHFPDKSGQHRYKFCRYVAPWLKTEPLLVTNRGRNKRTNDKPFGVMYGDRPLPSLKPIDIQTFLDQFEGSVSAYNAAFILVNAMFNWAIRMQLVDMRNPCTPFKRRKTIRQRRTYEPHEIKAIAHHVFDPPLEKIPILTETGRAKANQALQQGRVVQANTQLIEFCAFMGILLLTMARPKELLDARFDHFDLERLIWHKHDTKGIKLSKSLYEYEYRSVPIHRRVGELVKQQQARWPQSNLVFPSHTDQTQPRNNFRKSLARFKALPDVPDHFQLYDLKRIAISLMMVGQGVRREDVSHYVDHKGNIETTLIYDLGFVEPLRPVTDRLAEILGV